MSSSLQRAPQAPAIVLRGVSKKYHLYPSLRHRLYEALHPFKKTYHREFWALRDVTLEVPCGATLGILGVNGSGKSTLLQIICSILQPTTGTVEVRGRIAALIELGAGFNPDFTGRQNAEMNGVIMGLSAKDVRARIEKIREFADIGEFFDQPVKTYSSGMFMRVAFATAIHVEPDILIIDEALSVGDARFQEKCFRKFRDFQQAGKTILLVTHDRSAVPRLCTHAMLLHEGRVRSFGSAKEVTDQYSHLLALGDVQQSGAGNAAPRTANSSGEPLSRGGVEQAVRAFASADATEDRCPLRLTYNKNEFSYGLGGAQIIDYLLLVGDTVDPRDIWADAVATLYVKIRFAARVEQPLVGVSLKTADGTLVYGVHSGWLGEPLAGRAAGEVGCYRFEIRMSLAPGDWFFDVAVARSQTEMLHTREAMIHIRVDATMPSTGLARLQTRLTDVTHDASNRGEEAFMPTSVPGIRRAP